MNFISFFVLKIFTAAFQCSCVLSMIDCKHQRDKDSERKLNYANLQSRLRAETSGIKHASVYKMDTCCRSTFCLIYIHQCIVSCYTLCAAGSFIQLKIIGKLPL